MSKDNKELIRKKIKALLAKNEDNGATEEEALAALHKAQELMAKYMVSQDEISIKESKCIKLILDVFDTHYNLAFLIKPISEFCDSMCWLENNFKSKKIIFFGFEQDVMVAEYLYMFLCRTIVENADKYKFSSQYAKLKQQGYHGKTILTSFVHGLQMRLIEKIQYETELKDKFVKQTTSTDLVIIKENIILDEFKDLNLKLRKSSSAIKSRSKAAFNAGRETGAKINIRKGVKEKESQGVKLIS